MSKIHTLPQWRQDTPGIKDLIHLNNAGAALMPRQVIEAIQQHIHLEAVAGGYESADLRRADIEKVYASLATLLNTKASNIALTANATDAYSRALSSIPFEKGDVILTTDNDYVSNYIAFISLQKRYGVKVERMQQDGATPDLAALPAQMEKLRPKLVSVTHVPTNSGLVQPAAEIGKIVKTYGAWYLLDACQSAGQMPLDVKDLHCDFLSATFRKFLRGPRGMGFLYVSHEALAAGLEPLFPDLAGAEWTEVGHYQPRPDARRFEDWEFAYALVLGSGACVDYALGIGLAPIKAQVSALADYTREKLAQLPGASVLDQGEYPCGIVTVNFAGQAPLFLRDRLRERKINTSVLNRNSALIDFGQKAVDAALRVSPHYYNTKEEIDTLAEHLAELLG
jgi:selenocysteine lyase/cysteine desulfurase